MLRMVERESHGAGSSRFLDRWLGQAQLAFAYLALTTWASGSVFRMVVQISVYKLSPFTKTPDACSA